MKGKLKKVENQWYAVNTCEWGIGWFYRLHPEDVECVKTYDDNYYDDIQLHPFFYEGKEIDFEIEDFWETGMEEVVKVAKLTDSKKINLEEMPKEEWEEARNTAYKHFDIDDLPTTTSDLIDAAIWSLPFDERMKCWDLIEKLVEEEKQGLYSEEQVRTAISLSRVTNTENVIGTGLKLHKYSNDEIIKLISELKKD